MRLLTGRGPRFVLDAPQYAYIGVGEFSHEQDANLCVCRYGVSFLTFPMSPQFWRLHVLHTGSQQHEIFLWA